MSNAPMDSFLQGRSRDGSLRSDVDVPLQAHYRSNRFHPPLPCFAFNAHGGGAVKEKIMTDCGNYSLPRMPMYCLSLAQ